MSENVLYYVVTRRNINPCNLASLKMYGVFAQKVTEEISTNCENYNRKKPLNYIVKVSERNYQWFNDAVYEKGLIPIELNYDEVNFIADRE